MKDGDKWAGFGSEGRNGQVIDYIIFQIVNNNSCHIVGHIYCIAHSVTVQKAVGDDVISKKTINITGIGGFPAESKRSRIEGHSSKGIWRSRWSYSTEGSRRRGEGR